MDDADTECSASEIKTIFFHISCFIDSLMRKVGFVIIGILCIIALYVHFPFPFIPNQKFRPTCQHNTVEI